MKHKPTTKQKKDEPMVITLTKGQVQGIKYAPEEFMREKKAKAIFERAKAKMGMKEGGLAEATAKLKAKGLKVFTVKEGDLPQKKAGGLAEATDKLKAKGFEDGGEVKAEMTKKDKVVSIDTSPNSGLITTKGFGAGRRT